MFTLSYLAYIELVFLYKQFIKKFKEITKYFTIYFFINLIKKITRITKQLKTFFNANIIKKFKFQITAFFINVSKVSTGLFIDLLQFHRAKWLSILKETGLPGLK